MEERRNHAGNVHAGTCRSTHCPCYQDALEAVFRWLVYDSDLEPDRMAGVIEQWGGMSPPEEYYT